MSGPSLGRASAVMAAGTVLSRLTGFGRVLALAYVLGFERLTDTYNLANTTPNIVYELVLGGVLSATLVPVFVAMTDRSTDDSGSRSVDAVITLAAAAALAIAVAFALAAPAIIALYTVGNDGPQVADQRAVATTLLRLFAPQVLFYGLITMSTAVLQARRRFAAPMFAPVVNNLIVIGVILALPRGLKLAEIRGDTSLLWLLGLGTTAGVAAQAAVQWWAARRAGYRFRPRWAPGDEAVRKVLSLSGWTLGFVLANQAALYVVLVLANRERGAVSAYQAGQMFFVLPHAVIAVSLISALLPELSSRWAAGEPSAFRAQLARGIKATAALLIPAAVGYLLLAGPIVELVLQHGALRAADAEVTGRVLAAFAAGLPGFSTFLLLARAFQAMTDTRTVFWLYALENAINVALAFALFPAFGVVGLAASYAAAYSVAAIVAALVLRSRLGSLAGLGLGRALGGAAAGSALMAAAVVAWLRLVDGAAITQVAGGVVLGLFTYLIAARLLRIEGVEEITNRRATP